MDSVIVIKEAELDTGNWGDKSKWIKTSYNKFEGKHYTPSEHQEEHDDHEGHDSAEHDMSDELYEVGHNTVTFIIDKDGKKRLVFTGSTWSTADFMDDLNHLLHHDSGAEHSDHSGHDHH